MRTISKTLLSCAALLLVPLTAWAQTPITVTATITDPNGLPYSNALVQAQLVPTGGTPTIIVGGIPRQVGGQFNATADATGTFSMNLYCNQAGNGCSVITAGGANNTQWQFTIIENPGIAPPLGTGPQTFSTTLSLSGASGLSQSLSSTLSASALVLSRAVNSVSIQKVTNVAFASGTIPANTTGSVIFNASPTTFTWAQPNTSGAPQDGQRVTFFPFQPGEGSYTINAQTPGTNLFSVPFFGGADSMVFLNSGGGTSGAQFEYRGGTLFYLGGGEIVPSLSGVQGSPVLNGPLVASLTTTAAASDNVAINGVTSTSRCSLTATNSTAAADATGTFVSAKTANQITVSHPANAGRTWDILCTASS